MTGSQAAAVPGCSIHSQTAAHALLQMPVTLSSCVQSCETPLCASMHVTRLSLIARHLSSSRAGPCRALSCVWRDAHDRSSLVQCPVACVAHTSSPAVHCVVTPALSILMLHDHFLSPAHQHEAPPLVEHSVGTPRHVPSSLICVA